MREPAQAWLVKVTLQQLIFHKHSSFQSLAKRANPRRQPHHYRFALHHKRTVEVYRSELSMLVDMQFNRLGQPVKT